MTVLNDCSVNHIFISTDNVALLKLPGNSEVIATRNKFY